MDQSGRSEFIDTVLERWARSRSYLPYFATGVSDPVLLEEVHRVGVQSLFAGVKYGTIPFLEEIEPARRFELLENAEPGEAFSRNNHYWRDAGLQALDSDATRVEAPMATAKRYAPGMGNGGTDHFNKIHGYFDRTMEELNLPPESRETVKAALAPPEVGGER